ncbi:energy-coupling factor ABC transporter substrate-binding protein [Alkalibaculum sp. M08DMB]|uniref:Cobalt transport protein CbiN n=1 Tax=Alkalibaculum sporogenes TaxID=2655001 RepID=A0A6A7KAG2_9FIRM|nr:energy-coupling factor ABC transporter substrate-binding protein [Alkalibaculum sporogenes]MPW26271.1 energy-coupling factor ABC transporter substrate-binding protein [Alkalibaculum sporogenes]
MKKSTKFILVAIILLLIVTPLIFIDSEFGGADGEAEEMITVISPEYDPWFESFIEPASGEIESMLFSLQAAFGAGIIAYYLGYNRGKKVNATN